MQISPIFAARDARVYNSAPWYVNNSLESLCISTKQTETHRSHCGLLFYAFSVCGVKYRSGFYTQTSASPPKHMLPMKKCEFSEVLRTDTWHVRSTLRPTDLSSFHGNNYVEFCVQASEVGMYIGAVTLHADFLAQFTMYCTQTAWNVFFSVVTSFTSPLRLCRKAHIVHSHIWLALLSGEAWQRWRWW